MRWWALRYVVGSVGRCGEVRARDGWPDARERRRAIQAQYGEGGYCTLVKDTRTSYEDELTVGDGRCDEASGMAAAVMPSERRPRRRQRDDGPAVARGPREHRRGARGPVRAVRGGARRRHAAGRGPAHRDARRRRADAAADRQHADQRGAARQVAARKAARGQSRSGGLCLSDRMNVSAYAVFFSQG